MNQTDNPDTRNMNITQPTSTVQNPNNASMSMFTWQILQQQAGRSVVAVVEKWSMVSNTS